MRNATSILFLVVLFATFFHFADAQQAITGRVVDSETGMYIKNVSIAKVGTDFKTVTNAFGFFQIEATGRTNLQLSCDGYATTYAEISGKENVKIEMARRRYVAGQPIMEGPTFPGGLAAFYEYLDKNLHVATGAPKGTVTVQLLMDSAGYVIKDSVKIIQSLCKTCDREVLRVVKKSPKWNPAEQGGNIPVRIPIRFN